MDFVPNIRKALRRFWPASRASVALESVCCLCFTVVMVGGVFEVVNTLLVNDFLDRAAHAVARDNALQDPAATEEQLLERARQIIRAEVGDRLDPDLLRIEIDAYDNPSAMLLGELSQGAYGQLGGDGGDMVVVRLRFEPREPLDRIREATSPFHALAVARNERTTGLSEPAPAGPTTLLAGVP